MTKHASILVSLMHSRIIVVDDNTLECRVPVAKPNGGLVNSNLSKGLKIGLSN